jgi:hypothetical protein
VGKRTSTVETACPHCGHSPVPAEALRCPSCQRLLRQVESGPFRHNDREVAPELDLRTGTRLGGLDVLTSDAEARPGTVAAALALLGLLATGAGLGVLPLPGEPSGHLLLGLGTLTLALALWRLPAMARPLVIVSTPLQVAAWLWLGRHAMWSVSTLGVGLSPLLIFAGVTGATGPRRRSLVLAAVVGLVGYASALRLAEQGLPGLRIDAPALPLQALLPGGFEPVAQLDALTGYLPLSGLEAQTLAVGVADPVRGVGALWMIAGSTPPELAASQLATALAGDASPVRAHDELLGLPAGNQSSFRVDLGRGRVVSVAAAQLANDRTVLLVVGGPAEGLDDARRRLAAGATYRATSPGPDPR